MQFLLHSNISIAELPRPILMILNKACLTLLTSVMEYLFFSLHQLCVDIVPLLHMQFLIPALYAAP